MVEVVNIPIPKQYIGKWCAVEKYGTHNYDILWDNMIFDSEEHADLYLANRFRFQEDYGKYYRVVQITETYPIWQTYLNECTSSIEHLKQNLK